MSHAEERFRVVKRRRPGPLVNAGRWAVALTLTALSFVFLRGGTHAGEPPHPPQPKRPRRPQNARPDDPPADQPAVLRHG